MNKLSYDAVHNPAVVNIDLYVVPCYIEVLHSVGDNANADFDDPAAAAAVDDVVFDTTDRNLILLQHPSFLRLPGPVLEQFGVSGPVIMIGESIVSTWYDTAQQSMCMFTSIVIICI